MFESLFGSEMPLAARFFIAFLGRAGADRIDRMAGAAFRRQAGSEQRRRGRQPRLAVIDAATVDGRRRLVLIRRDNVEHLLMIGGPTDLVVEPNIVRAVSARDVAREPSRATPAESAVRPAATLENGWPLQPAGEPAAARRQPDPTAPLRPKNPGWRRSQARVRVLPTALPAWPRNCRRA